MHVLRVPAEGEGARCGVRRVPTEERPRREAAPPRAAQRPAAAGGGERRKTEEREKRKEREERRDVAGKWTPPPCGVHVSETG